MAFAGQTFSVGQILTASQLNTMDANIDVVRIAHKGSSAPAELAAGIAWIDDTTSGNWLYKVYDGSAWISVFKIDETTDTATPINLGEGGRNAIINGSLDIWQRGTTITSPALNDYSADRWVHLLAGAGVITVSRDTEVPNNDYTYSMKIVPTTNDSSLAAADNYGFAQNIEGNIARRFRFGEADAKALTLSFWVRSSDAGTYCVSFQNSAVNRSYVAEYTIDTGDTWEQKEISITADTGGTWVIDTGIGLRVTWSLGTGSNFEGTKDQWNGAQDYASTSQFNWMDSTANTFYITGIQLELGSFKSDFDHQGFPAAMALCQRYFRKSFPYSTTPADNAGDTGALHQSPPTGGRLLLSWFAGIPMRTAPTVTTYNPNASTSDDWRNHNGGTNTTASTGDISEYVVQIYGGVTAANAGDELVIHATADAELT